jgi:hypothetical protein
VLRRQAARAGVAGEGHEQRSASWWVAREEIWVVAQRERGEGERLTLCVLSTGQGSYWIVDQAGLLGLGKSIDF